MEGRKEKKETSNSGNKEGNNKIKKERVNKKVKVEECEKKEREKERKKKLYLITSWTSIIETKELKINLDYNITYLA